MGPKLQLLDPNKGPITQPKVSNSDEEDGDVPTGLPVIGTVTSSAVRWRNKSAKGKHKIGNIRTRRFERRYTELGPSLIPEQKRVDYVLVYPNRCSKDTKDPDKKRSLEEKEFKRDCFEKAMLQQGFFLQKDIIKDNVFVKLHCPFKRLCIEAEAVKLEMRLKDCPNIDPEPTNFVTRFVEKYFETDDEVDFISAPFLMDRIQLYQDYEDPTHFFRPATRSLLVDHILINIDIRQQSDFKLNKNGLKPDNRDVDPEKAETSSSLCSCCCCYGNSKDDEDKPESSVFSTLLDYIPCFKSKGEPIDPFNSDKQMQKWDDMKQKKDEYGRRFGLPYLLMKNVYLDAFILHEESERSKEREELQKEFFAEGDGKPELNSDPRKEMDDAWTRPFKFQPLWKIRNYFGEKIALYFAWTGLLTTSLWSPTLFGVGIFLYGLISSGINGSTDIPVPENATVVETIKIEMEELLSAVKLAFDNNVTPFFALIVCLWGTVFLESWKRKSATLAYEWDVDNYDSNEPDRPQFFGTKVKKDPITSEDNWFYPVRKQLAKYICSTSALLFMVMLVLASLVGVIVYRVIISVDMCPGFTAIECLLTTNIVSAILNALSILLLGKIYDKVAVKLTDWENHRTQSGYDDALIIKLFAFQFANSYASCVYIAFFRGNFDIFGVFGLGEEYRDDCSGTCMSQLSFQVLILMLAKPFPKMFKDILLPLARKLWRIRPSWCCRCKCCPCCQNKVMDTNPEDKIEADKEITNSYIEMEYIKPSLGEFTLGEYTEKIIQYGFLMLFAASFPLAPLLALLTNLIDIRVDAKRMLWWYRRPVAYIRKDIGRWYSILEFVNMCGVISNGFLIAFTSSWGQQFEFSSKLWIVIIFEHAVFGLKFLLAYLIADVPRPIRLAMRREKFQVARILESVAGTEPTDYATLVPQQKKRRKTRSSNYETFDENGEPVQISEEKEHKVLKNDKHMKGNETEAKKQLEKGDNSTKPIVEEASESAATPKSPTDSSKEDGSVGIQDELWYCGDENDKSQGVVSISGVDAKAGIVTPRSKDQPSNTRKRKGSKTEQDKASSDSWPSSSSDSDHI